MEPEGKEATQLEHDFLSKIDPPETGHSPEDILVVSVSDAVQDNFEKIWNNDDIVDLSATATSEAGGITMVKDDDDNDGEEKKEDDERTARWLATMSEKMIIARNRQTIPEDGNSSHQVLAFCSNAVNDDNYSNLPLNLTLTQSEDVGSVEILTVEMNLSEDADAEDTAQHEMIDLSLSQTDSIKDGSQKKQKEDTNEMRKPTVQSLRALFESDSAANFDAGGLSVDMEKFYLDQRARIVAYQQKRQEVLVPYFEANTTKGTATKGINETSTSVACARRKFEGTCKGSVFVVHQEYGLLLIKKTKDDDEASPKFRIPSETISESDFATAEFVTTGKSQNDLQLDEIPLPKSALYSDSVFYGTIVRCKDGLPKRRILSAARLAATRDLFSATGIDSRGSLDRLIPANLRRDVFYTVNDDSTLQNQFKRQVYFFLFLADSDFKYDGIASTFNQSGIVFEKDASVASDMLAHRNGDGVADAFLLSLEANNPLYNRSIPGLQRLSLTKLDRASTKMETRKDTDQEESEDFEGDTVGSISEIIDVLSYISDVWGCKKDQCSGDLSSLLKFLASSEFPTLEVNEAAQLQRELDSVRSWRRKYDGLRPQQQTNTVTDNTTLEQLVSMKAVLCEHKELCESIQLLAKKSVGKVQYNSGPHIAVSNPESRNQKLGKQSESSVVAGVKNYGCTAVNCFSPNPPSSDNEISPAGRRVIAGGDLFHASKWEAFRDHPACHLKNKIVLCDQEDVEVEAVVLKTHHGNPRAFDSSLCVLNNEKPSSLKLSKRANTSTNRRVKFLLKQFSCVENVADSETQERGILCCWPDV